MSSQTTLSIRRKPKGVFGQHTSVTEAPDRPEKSAEPDLTREQRAEQQTKKERYAKSQLSRLMAVWPQLLDADNPEPLKIGIHHDMLAASEVQGLNLTKKQIRAALKLYVSGRDYLLRLTVGGERTGLDGQPAGEVTEKQIGLAKAMLEGGV